MKIMKIQLHHQNGLDANVSLKLSFAWTKKTPRYHWIRTVTLLTPLRWKIASVHISFLVKVSFFQKILCCLSDRHILQTFYCPYVLKKCSGAVKCLQNMAIRQVSYYLLKKTYLYPGLSHIEETGKQERLESQSSW